MTPRAAVPPDGAAAGQPAARASSLDSTTPGRAERLPWRRAMAGALVVTLVRPATWVVALAGFVAGGGIIVLAWPIVVLPTPSGLQNLLGAPISTLAFGAPSRALVTMAAVIGASSAVLVVTGLLVGSWAERRGIALVLEGAAEEGYPAAAPSLDGAPGPLRVAAVRLLGLVPPIIVAALAWPTLYAVTYHELILPGDLAVPLPIRVIEQVPLQLVAVVGSWLLADTAAAVGVRRLVVERRGVLASWALGWADLARRPLRILGATAIGIAALVLAAGPALAAAALAWFRVREALELAANSPIGIAVVALWVAIWLGALVLAGVGAAVRSAAWTLEGARRA
jgi:hypothetical protein